MPENNQNPLNQTAIKTEIPLEPKVVPPQPEPVIPSSSLPTTPPIPDIPQTDIPPAESTSPAASSPATETEAPLSLPENPKIKKIFPIFLLILLILGAVFLVIKFILPRLNKSAEVSLTYWGLWEPEEVLKGVLLDWEKEHPQIKINFIRNSPTEYRERLQSALARNEGPDIFRFHIAWTPMFKNELSAVPSSVMSASQFEAVYYPVISDNLRSGANYLGLPLMIDNLALFYNVDILQAAGKQPPTSWEELRQLAVDLTVKDKSGKIQTAGIALGTASNVDHWSDILGLMMLQNGVDLSNPGDCHLVGGEEICLGPDALTFYSLFTRTDQVWDESMPASTQTFAGGKLAMYFAPSWRVFDLQALNPKLNFKITSVPQLPGSNITWASFWVEGVAKKSQHQTEAWEFLKYLSSPEVLEKLYASQSNLRSFGEIYPRVEMADKLIANPLTATFLNQAPQSQTWYLCSNTFDNGLNDLMIRYFADAVNAVNKGQSAKEALQTAGQGVSQLLSKYEITAPLAR
jgi:ABC-type glycerol-3-phosphate transport system substrate-binding protein